MTSYDRDSWEQRWSKALREHGGQARAAPTEHASDHSGSATFLPAVALDAGCGHGAETLWLAARGWQVTAVDFSATALAHARSTAEAVGADIAERIDWVEGDLATWTPQPARYDLVVCLYVHVAGSVEELVRRMASGVARAGRCSWSATARSTPPPEPHGGGRSGAGLRRRAVAALDPADWEVVVAEDRPRAAAGSGVDAVIRARRRS